MSRARAEWVDPKGELVRLEADSTRDELLEALEPAQRLALRSLRTLEAAPGGPADAAWAGRELARLLRAGVPLAPALQDLARAAGSGALGRELARAAAAAGEGKALTELLAAGPLATAFANPLLRGLLEAGERASRLPELLLEAAGLARRLAEVRRRAVLALAYPLLVTGLLVVLVAVVGTVVGPQLPALSATVTRPRAGGAVVATLSLLGQRPLVTWSVAGLLLAGLVAARHALGGGLAALRLRPVRDAATLHALAALVGGGVPPADAARLLEAGSPALLGPDAARDLVEGAAVADALARAAVVDEAERLGLAAAQQAGPRELAAALREVAGWRLDAFEDRVRALCARLALGLELSVGAAALGLALPFLGSVWR